MNEAVDKAWDYVQANADSPVEYGVFFERMIAGRWQPGIKRGFGTLEDAMFHAERAEELSAPIPIRDVVVLERALGKWEITELEEGIDHD